MADEQASGQPQQSIPVVTYVTQQQQQQYTPQQYVVQQPPNVVYIPQQPQYQSVPTNNNNASKTVDGIRVILDNGGVRATVIKFILWIALPLVILLGVGYFLYTSFFLRKATISTRGGLNNSTIYKDEKTDWNVQVTDVNNQANTDAQIAQFEELARKIKGLYK